jgi:Zn-dependent metalloprotease
MEISMCHVCQIVPMKVLRRFSRDKRLNAAQKKSFADTMKIDAELRKLRTQAATLSRVTQAVAPPAALVAAAAAPPKVTVNDCSGNQPLPGSEISNPSGSSDQTASRVFAQTTKVAQFYGQVFNRNSIDGMGMTMISSIHYGTKYNNAFWNGTLMAYGDGDGSIFVDFSQGNDVIGHELTHGVTQHSLQLDYADQPGGLNESISDCFGSMFRQWSAGQNVNQADWLIGSDIMGPAAKTGGKTCLRDMANPAANHCLSPQPTKFSQYKDGMDPHESSGIPNLAFTTIAKSIGGNSWDKTGQVWYQAVTGSGSNPSMKMKAFANRTRAVAAQLYPNDTSVAGAVDAGWKAVGL